MCSVALAEEGAVIASRQTNEGYSHAENLAPFVDQVIREAEIEFQDLDAIAVSEGPGSYTGLRIGVSLAKGLCYALNIPLIGVPTLSIMCANPAVQRILQTDKSALLCPMLDARRMEVYTALFDQSLRELDAVRPMIVDEHSFKDYLEKSAVVFFGNGSAKFNKITNNPSALFVDDIWPLAADMASFSEASYSNGEFEDVAYFEPTYLKEFQATTPKEMF